MKTFGQVLDMADELTLDEPESLVSVLAADAFDLRLKTHKLKGNLAGSWACSGGYELRVAFQFVTHKGSEAILLAAVGSHDEVY